MQGLPNDISELLIAVDDAAGSVDEARDLELRTRIKHLLAELETVKESYTQSIIDAIEERDQRLLQQQQAMSRLEAVMQLAAEGIVTMNEDEVIETFNEVAGRIFDYDPHEVLGRSISMLVPNRCAQRADESLATYLKSGHRDTPGTYREMTGKRRDGSEFRMEIAVSEVPLGSERVFVGIFRDATERRRLECQMVQSQKMESVGQLAAGVAHEINTPTQYVGDNMRFLEDAFRDLSPLLDACKQLGAADSAQLGAEDLVTNVVTAAKSTDLDYLMVEIPKAIDQSLDGVARVNKIVRSMKDFSHPGGQTKQAVDLNRALESTLTVCRNEWKYVADAVTDFDPDLPLVTCLPDECNQVFLNLIINAAHAIGDKLAASPAEKGLIRVTTRRHGKWAEVRICDTGTGIPEEFRRKIFDPFFTTKEVGRGTGQGLTIARSVITQKHGGTIDVETEIGTGTTFIVRLPISGAAGVPGKSEPDNSDSPMTRTQ
jgi:PAS domain S-box-containing protein